MEPPERSRNRDRTFKIKQETDEPPTRASHQQREGEEPSLVCPTTFGHRMAQQVLLPGFSWVLLGSPDRPMSLTSFCFQLLLQQSSTMLTSLVIIRATLGEFTSITNQPRNEEEIKLRKSQRTWRSNVMKLLLVQKVLRLHPDRDVMDCHGRNDGRASTSYISSASAACCQPTSLTNHRTRSQPSRLSPPGEELPEPGPREPWQSYGSQKGPTGPRKVLRVLEWSYESQNGPTGPKTVLRVQERSYGFQDGPTGPRKVLQVQEWSCWTQNGPTGPRKVLRVLEWSYGFQNSPTGPRTVL